MSKPSQYFVHYRNFLRELTAPEPRRLRPVPVKVRMKAATRGVQARLATIRAQRVADSLLRKGGEA